MKWDDRKFFEVTREIYYPSEEEYYKEHAECIIDIMEKNELIKAKTLIRQRYSPKYIFSNFF